MKSIRTVRIQHLRTANTIVTNEAHELGLRFEELPRILELGVEEPLLTMRRVDLGGGQSKARNRLCGPNLFEVKVEDAEEELGACTWRGELESAGIWGGVVEVKAEADLTGAASGGSELRRELFKETLEEKKEGF